MTDLVEDFAPASATAPALRRRPQRLRHSLVRILVAEAPPDYDEVMAQVRPLPGWVRLLLLIGSSVAGWAAIIAGVAVLLR